jgi:F0F1-type ATP synthase membrane subunit b/b'
LNNFFDKFAFLSWANALNLNTKTNMNQMLKTLSRVVMISLIAGLALGGATSCKSKKKLAAEQAAAEYASKVEQATKDLNAIIDRQTTWSLDQQQQRVNTIKGWNLNDPEVDSLIVMAQTEIDNQRAEIARKAEEERLRQQEAASKTQDNSLDTQLKAITTASTVDAANAQINKMLQLFASPDVPVLIIVSQEGGITDYDKPTTASRFLNILKDTKNYNYSVSEVKKDGSGKITELDLIKKF